MGPDHCGDCFDSIILPFIWILSTIRVALIYLPHFSYVVLVSLYLKHDLFNWLSYILLRSLPSILLQIIYDARSASRVSSRTVVRKFYDRGKSYRPAFAAKLCLYSFIMIYGAFSMFYTGACFPPSIELPDPPEDGLIASMILIFLLILSGGLTFVGCLTRSCSRCLRFNSNTKRSLSSLSAFSVIASLSSARLDSMGSISFDIASVGSCIIDNCATGHICADSSMFIGAISDVNDDTKVATIGDTMLKPKGVGTVEWCWKDVTGTSHTYRLHNVFYFPDSPVNILSLTAFAKQLDDNAGTCITTWGDHSLFLWDKGQYECTLSHPPSGLPELSLYHSSNYCRSFYCDFISALDVSSSSCQEGNYFYFDPCVFHFHVGDNVLYTKDGTTHQASVFKMSGVDVAQRYELRLQNGNIVSTSQEFIRFPDDPDIGIVPTKKTDLKTVLPYISKSDLQSLLDPPKLSQLQREYTQWHQKLNHLSHSQMMRLVDRGILPSRLTALRNESPKCPSCILGKAHRRNWRTRAPYGSIRTLADKCPGTGTSIDQLISAQPGFVPQIRGKLTSAKITTITVFVDHYSDFTFVYLQKSASQEETLEAKAAYEKCLRTFGHKVKSYHADNGRFMDTTFQLAVADADQSITFCGVGSHHQNGIDENRIKILTETARTLLLHAQRMWPEAISQVLWPFAIKTACDHYNQFHLNAEGQSPMERIAGSTDSFHVDNFHPWGCPVYILDSRLQSGIKGFPKWEPRTRLGIFVGHSPVHARSVALVLNPTTGHISPQFHVIFDDDFTTVPFLRKGEIPPNWNELVHTGIVSLDADGFQSGLSSFNLPSSVDTLSEKPTHAPSTITLHEGGSIDRSTSHEGDSIVPNLPPERELHDTGKFSVQASDAERALSSHLQPDMLNLNTAGLRRSERSRVPTTKLNNSTEPTLKKRIFGLFSIVSVFSSCGYQGPFTSQIRSSLSVSSFLARSIFHYE